MNNAKSLFTRAAAMTPLTTTGAVISAEMGIVGGPISGIVGTGPARYSAARSIGCSLTYSGATYAAATASRPRLERIDDSSTVRDLPPRSTIPFCLGQQVQTMLGPLAITIIRATALIGQKLCQDGNAQKLATDIRTLSGKVREAFTPPPPDPGKLKEAELYGGDMTKLAIGAMAKFAKADGIVTKQEIQVLESAFHDLGLVGEARQQAVVLFGEAKAGPLAYADVLDLFARLSRGNEEDHLALLVLLMRVAHADGSLSDQSEHLLRYACTTLGCDYQRCLSFFRASQQEQAKRMRAAQAAQGNQLKAAYEILGCSPADSEEHLKHRYRQLVRDFHPDTIAGKGLSPEFTRFAEEKFKQIQAAYEFLVEQHR